MGAKTKPMKPVPKAKTYKVVHTALRELNPKYASTTACRIMEAYNEFQTSNIKGGLIDHINTTCGTALANVSVMHAEIDNLHCGYLLEVVNNLMLEIYEYKGQIRKQNKQAEGLIEDAHLTEKSNRELEEKIQELKSTLESTEKVGLNAVDELKTSEGEIKKLKEQIKDSNEAVKYHMEQTAYFRLLTTQLTNTVELLAGK